MNSLSQFNQNLFLEIFHLSRQNSLVDFFMIFGAEYLVYIAFVLIVFIFWKNFKKDKNAIILLLLSLLTSLIIIRLVEYIFYEPRPFLTYSINPLIYQPTDGSFPSLHTATITVLAISFFSIKRKYRQLMIVPIFWTGFARVYTGVHFPGDILGGIIIGIVSVLVVQNFLKFTGIFKRPNNL